ncbi:MAG: POTRA domain-containing protein [Terriglobia bacterium]
MNRRPDSSLPAAAGAGLPRTPTLALALCSTLRSAMLWLVVALALVAPAPGMPPQYGPLAGIKIPPESIRFVGNRAISSEDLRAIFRSAGTVTAGITPDRMDIYDTNRISHVLEMIQMFYRNRGYIKARVELPEVSFMTPAAGGKMELVIKITENIEYRLGRITVEGLKAIDQSQAIAMLNLQPEAAINFSKLNAGTVALRETYLTLGYLDIAIQANLDAPDRHTTANLKISVMEGKQYHLGKITLVGDSPIHESLLRESLPFQAGDVFGEKAFNACLDTLNALGTTPVLTANDVSFNYDKANGIVDVSIYLQGKPKPK